MATQENRNAQIMMRASEFLHRAQTMLGAVEAVGGAGSDFGNLEAGIREAGALLAKNNRACGRLQAEALAITGKCQHFCAAINYIS